VPIANLIFSELYDKADANHEAKSHQTKFTRHRSGVDRTHKTNHGKITRGFFLKAAQNTVLGYYFPGFSRGLVHYLPIGTG
jgi:hypothetical protein